MPITGLVLYGSHARGDAHTRSDVDLLAIVAHRESLQRRDHDHLKIQVHTRKTLQFMFDEGSLFAWHLSAEGRIVYDDDGWLRTLLDSFVLRSDYTSQRVQAGNLGWLLIDHGVRSDPADVQTWIRTVMYVARTVALSRLAERRPPVPLFTRDAVCEALDSELLRALWAHKHRTCGLEQVPGLFAEFLREQQVPRPLWMTKSPADHLLERPHEFDPVAFTRFGALLGRSDLGSASTYV